MVNARRVVSMLVVGWAVVGCAGSGMDLGAYMQEQTQQLARETQRAQARQRLIMDLQKNPDTPEWHDARQKIVMAQGDRVIDKDFNRVFDSMTVAIATLESKVHNMERVSGYITASLPSMPPAQRDAMRREALHAYMAAKGYPPQLAESQPATGTSRARRELDDDDTAEVVYGVFEHHIAGMTLSLVRQGERQTKVKLRFDNVYYPRQVVEYYRIVWTAVDKQIFLDQSLD
jgi:hypothetical protein